MGHFELIFKVHFSTIFLLFFVPRLPGAKNVKLGFEKEVPREDLEGFGDDFGRLWGEAQMHFRLEISSIEIVVLWN